MLATYTDITNLQVLELNGAELLYVYNDTTEHGGYQEFSVEFDGQTYTGEVKFYASCNLFDVLLDLSGESVSLVEFVSM